MMLTKITLFPQRAKCQGQIVKASINHFFQELKCQKTNLWQVGENLKRDHSTFWQAQWEVKSKTILQVEFALSNQLYGNDDWGRQVLL